MNIEKYNILNWTIYYNKHNIAYWDYMVGYDSFLHEYELFYDIKNFPLKKL